MTQAWRTLNQDIIVIINTDYMSKGIVDSYKACGGPCMRKIFQSFLLCSRQGWGSVPFLAVNYSAQGLRQSFGVALEIPIEEEVVRVLLSAFDCSKKLSALIHQR